MSESPYITLENVTRTYGRKKSQVFALKDVSLSIAKGERVALVGRSGSGKSTLLNLLGGLDRPSSGTIRVDGASLDELSNEQRADYRLNSVGLIFQAFNLIATRTALQNVEMPFTLAERPREERRKLALEAIDAVGLAKRAEHLPNELSGGEQQRIAIARALVNQPGLILADEPTGNLDSVTAGEVSRLLQEYSDKHQTTVVLVTHDEELATTFANRTVRLRDGQLIDS
ncbi:MAG: ABC transporter ATP-binding protein [Planctomycetaceae bacterium]